MGASAYDIQELPIEKTIAFFAQLGRMQSFCKKYNLKIKDIQDNEELQDRLKTWLYTPDDRGIDSIGDDDEPLDPIYTTKLPKN
jgi:hypothetical protein